MGTKRIGIFVGSLRKGSYSRSVAEAVADMITDDYEIEFVDISSLPMYNQDFDENGAVPATWETFRSTAKQLDAFLFVTPEYNRSVPAVLKNALDVGSRPYGSSVWYGKPGAIISVSGSRISGFGANHHLRQSMVFLNVYVMQQPEAYIGDVISALDADGRVVDERLRDTLHDFTVSFMEWIAIFNHS